MAAFRKGMSRAETLSSIFRVVQKPWTSISDTQALPRDRLEFLSQILEEYPVR